MRASYDSLMYVRCNAVMHLARYYFAVSVLKDYGVRTVLDVGCGCGYGTEILVKSGFNAVGYDIDVEQLDEARKRFGGVPYVLSPLHQVVNHTDGVVCFEVLEHLDDLQSGLAHIRRLANKVVVFSVPNGQYPTPPEEGPHAHRHFLLEEKHFPPETKWFYQTFDGLIYDFVPSCHPPNMIGILRTSG